MDLGGERGSSRRELGLSTSTGDTPVSSGTIDAPTPTPSSWKVANAEEHILRVLVSPLIWAWAILGLLTTGTTLYRSLLLGWGPQDLLFVSFCGLTLVVAVFQERLRPQTTLAFTTLLSLAVFIAGTWNLGLMAGATQFLVVGLVPLCLFGTRRQILLLGLATASYLAFLSTQVCSGGHQLLDPRTLMLAPRHWLTYSTCLAMSGTMVILVILRYRRAYGELAADLERERTQLRQALDEIRTLEGILPICSGCRRIRGEDDEWIPLERYIRKETGTEFSHGVCPDCLPRLYPDLE